MRIRRRQLAALGLVVGLGTAAVGFAVLASGDGEPAPVRTEVAAATTTTTTAPATTAPSTTTTVSPKPVTETVPAPPEVTGAGQLRLPTIDVAAPVTEVRVRPNGELEVPELPSQVGWWADGARPGSGRGSVVIDGHVDSARYGRGAFFRLRELAVGDPVMMAALDGTVRQYQVTDRLQFAKDQLPWAEVFSQEVPERLVLVTCGGEFDRSSRHYTDNVVVYAAPA